MPRAEQHLEAAFGKAAPAHYEWQTAAPYVSERERDLVRAAFLPLGRRVLDLGCAEGATLYHLGEPDGAVGVDLFEDKLAFARGRLERCTFVTGNAYELPFEDGAFDHVLVRDVIHHLDEPLRGLRECRRVIARGGRIDVLEPCRNSPLIFLHALLKPEERGELRSTMTFLSRSLEEAGFEVTMRARHQPLPLHRIVFHPDMGNPALGKNETVRAAVDGIERAAERIVPRLFWAYLHVRAAVPG
jgi:SAM-dependent methyltransferase